MSDDRREDSLFEARSGPERWILPYFEDLALWPVLLVVLAHLAAFVAAALVFAVRDRRPVAIVGVVLLIVATVRVLRWEWAVRGGLGAFTAAILVTWLVSTGFAWMGWHWSFL